MTDRTADDLALAGDDLVPPSSGSAVVAAPPLQRGPLARYGAALLSAMLPGLGDLVVHRHRRAAIFLAPVAIGLAALIVWVVINGPLAALTYLADPEILGAFLVVQLVILGWRLLAVAFIVMDGRFPRLGPRDALPIALLAVLVIAPQAGVVFLSRVAQASEVQMFDPVQFPVFADESRPPASIGPGASGDPGSPSPDPTAGPKRTNVLLIGVDQGPDRNTFLTDTMIVASLDPVGKTVSMVSIPRDMVDVPLARGGVFNPKINGLVSYVRWHPGAFPGYNGNGQAVLAGALGKLLGIRIDYYAQVNLPGFVQVVNAVHGITVDVDHGMCDAAYDEYGYEGSHYSIGPGRHHFDGNEALAYARIRKSAGESDFTRAARQQQVLVALRDKIVHGGFLEDPVALLRATGGAIQTNVPPRLLPTLAPLMTQIGRKAVYQAVIRYPMVHPSAKADARGSIQIPDVKKIRELGAAMFTTPGTDPPARYGYKEPSSTATGPVGAAPTCSLPHSNPTPRPTPRPTPKPTPKPTTPKATPSPTPSPTPAKSTSAEPS